MIFLLLEMQSEQSQEGSSNPQTAPSNHIHKLLLMTITSSNPPFLLFLRAAAAIAASN